MLLVASIALAVLLASGVSVVSLEESGVSAQTLKKPNIVFILADDMRYDDLKYMPKTRSLLGSKGRRFDNAFVSLSMCCPSRATIMRGQYAHNTGVWFNNGSQGGWQGYKSRGYEKDNVATRLYGAGYRTGLFGKYLNGYEKTTSVPPGWVDWFAMLPSDYFNYLVNDNGTIRTLRLRPQRLQHRRFKGRRPKSLSTQASAKRKPFFAYVAPKAPHEPAIPAPRDRHTYDGKKAPRYPSFNEKNISDKPSWISSLPTTQLATRSHR